MTAIAVLVPVLARPRAARPLADSLDRSQADARLVFVCSPGDRAQQGAAAATGADVITADWPPGPADYARKINLAAGAATEPWLFLAADDLRFHPGWDQVALRVGERSQACVVGTNDRANPLVQRGRHSTHSLVRRAYVLEQGTVDQPGVVLHEGYDHNFCDNELVETARARGCFAFARGAVVEHLHPLWGTADMDATYERGLAGFERDRRLFNQRRRLWMRASPRPGRPARPRRVRERRS